MKISIPKGKAHRFLISPPSRTNILHGSVRSGKTVVSILKWIHEIKTHATAESLMVGKTERTLIRNVINPMMEYLPEDAYHLNKGSAELTLYGKRVYLVGANDERSEQKIRGMSLQFAYVDEASIIPESFIKMLQSRLSEAHARLYMTTNPDSPYHWIKKEVIDNAEELGASIWHFVLDDNPYLDQEYVAALKREYSGLWYRRYILGEWCLAEGVVYPMWDEDKHVRPAPADLSMKTVGVDYGIVNPTVFLLGGIDFASGNFHVKKEYYYDSRTTLKQKTDSELADDFMNFVRGEKISRAAVDPSATSFIAELRKRGIPVVEAVNDVIPGIQAVSHLLEQEMLFVDASCENLREEFAAYLWDASYQKKGKDVPKKENDHCADALRYLIMDLTGQSRTEISRPKAGLVAPQRNTSHRYGRKKSGVLGL